MERGGAARSMPAYDDGTTPTLVTEKPPAIAVRTANTGANGSGVTEELAIAATQDQTLFQPSTDSYVVRRLTPTECERLQGFPTVVMIGDGMLSADDLIAIALANNDILVDFDAGKIYGVRGAGGIRLEQPRELGFKHPNGYIYVNLSAGGQKKQVRVHRIVYAAAHGRIPEGMVVDHINGIKNDNRLCNLQLLTPEDNSHKAKEDGIYEFLSDPETNKRMIPYEIRMQIQYEYQNGLTYRQLAKKYGCSKSTVSNIIHECDWTDIGEWTDSKGKKRQTTDGNRYKALGNSFAVPVVRWLGERLQAVENLGT